MLEDDFWSSCNSLQIMCRGLDNKCADRSIYCNAVKKSVTINVSTPYIAEWQEKIKELTQFAQGRNITLVPKLKVCISCERLDVLEIIDDNANNVIGSNTFHIPLGEPYEISQHLSFKKKKQTKKCCTIL